MQSFMDGRGPPPLSVDVEVSWVARDDPDSSRSLHVTESIPELRGDLSSVAAPNIPELLGDFSPPSIPEFLGDRCPGL